MIDDMPALLSWVEDEELKAHNNKFLCTTDVAMRFYYGRELAFSEMRNKILNNPTELHRTLMNKPIKEVRKD